jgi:hypothetical protein
LRTTVFVEGTSGDSSRHVRDKIEQLWAVVLPEKLNCPQPANVVGFSKGHFQAMNRSWKSGEIRTTSTNVPFDAFFSMELERRPFDVAIVVWDLMPPWDKEARPSRCIEVRDFYRAMGESEAIPERFRDGALRRLAEVEQATGQASVVHGSIVGVCMEPMFEGMLADEKALREALGVRNQQVKGWPKHWGSNDPKEVLDRAIRATRRLSPLPAALKRVPGNMETRPNDWNLFLTSNPAFHEIVRSHDIATRYARWLAAAA